MKKICTVIAFVLAVSQIFCAGCGYTNTEDKLLRVHVRADSDSADAQKVKLEIAEAIECYLSSELEGIDDYPRMLGVVRERLGAVEAIASGMLRRNGIGYGASVALTRETFAERKCGDKTIPAGEYDSLTVRLGTGGGDNWWTVIYPDSPSVNVRYKSLIAELLG